MARWRLSILGAMALASCLVEIKEPVDDATGGGDAGTTSTGGDGGSADGGGGGSSGPCPDDMVHATDGADVSFCIDKTEVTQAAYVQFLASTGGNPPPDQPPECSGNTSLTNEMGACPDFTTGSQMPVWCVDWCDAHAYCAWAGKRLCGALAGGSLAFDDAPVAGEWHFACTGGLKTAYPYGNDPIDGACNVTDTGVKAEVESYPQCEGGFPGLFDMQGNVIEWIDSCETGSGANCHVRGGHTWGTAAYWTCNNVQEEPLTDDYVIEVGIRCCRDAD